MERFCIITNRDKDEELAVTNQIRSILTENNRKWVLTEEHIAANGCHYTRAEEIPKDTECVIVLGGDGTLLQVAHDLEGRDIPILGINLGTLGFLAETELSEVERALQLLFEDQYLIEEHMMLTAEFLCKEKPEEVPDALNDLVVTRSGFSRLIHLGIYVNGELVNDYRGDGVIISTPTGSTGYNLSAGGPILSPSAEMMVITPVCPHSLNTRSIVVSAKDTIEVRIRMSKKTQDEEAIATIDGSYAVNLKAEDSIVIRQAERTTRLIRFRSGSFFQILRMKLNGN